MTAQQHLRVVSHEDAPPPLLPPDVSLDDMPEVMLNIKWLTDSRFVAMASAEEFRAAVRLHARSQHEKPAATLPGDDVELAFLAGFGQDNIRAWHAVKAVALEGWTLCSDGRYYRRDMAIKALGIWIKLISDRTKQAKGAAKRKGIEFNAEPYIRANRSACNALYALDPTAKILRNYMNEDPDITADTADRRDPDSFPDNDPDNDPDNYKGKELKGTKISQYISPTASAVGAGQPGKDSGASEARSEKRTQAEPVPPWPPTAWPDFWALWPNKVAKDEAEPVFAELMLRPPIPFEQLISAVIKYTEGKPEGYAWKYPATWLNKRSWTDEWPDKKPPPIRGHSPPSKFRGGPPRQPFQPTGGFRGRP